MSTGTAPMSKTTTLVQDCVFVFGGSIVEDNFPVKNTVCSGHGSVSVFFMNTCMYYSRVTRYPSSFCMLKYPFYIFHSYPPCIEQIVI